MISVKFFLKKSKISGFEISGHADDAPQGRSIICAAVSSVAYMTVNTVTEVLKVGADVEVDDKGKITLSLKDNQAIDACCSLLSGLRLHLQNLQTQYSEDISVNYLEV